MREYIVEKDILNLRSSAGDADDNNFIGQVYKGETIYLMDDEIVALPPKGGTSKIWKRDAQNRVMALDGLRTKNYQDKKSEFLADTSLAFLHNSTSDESQWNVSWGFVDLEVYRVWQNYQTKGAGVKVAIIDTGLKYQLSPFCDKPDLISYDNAYLQNEIQSDCVDIVGHGTDCAACFCAQGAGYFGVAPEASLIVIKIANPEASEIPSKAILQGFKDAIRLEADIISFSASIADPKDPFLAGIHEQVQLAKSKNIIVCAAVGDVGEGTHPPNSTDPPAYFDECLSIGAYDQQNVRSQASSVSDHLKIIAPGEGIPSLYAPGDANKGSSFAAPVVAGAIALLKSVAKSQGKNLSNDTVFDLLKRSANQDIAEYNTSEHGWGKIDILTAINLLNTPLT